MLYSFIAARFGFSRAALVVVSLGSVTGVSADQLSSTVNGLTGYVFAPSARTSPKGALGIDYSPSVPGADRLDGHNLSMLFGLSSFLELSGRVAANTLQCEMYTQQNCGMRDLSASAKLGFDLGWLAPGAFSNSIRVAAGATDVGGAATSFRSTFLVGTYVRERWELSGGFARGESNLSRHMPLDGPFVAAAYAPTNWIKLHSEVTRDHRIAGLTLSNESLLAEIGFPKGSRLHLQFNASLGGERELPQPHVALGMRLPLDFTLGRPTPSSSVSSMQLGSPVVNGHRNQKAPLESNAQTNGIGPAPVETLGEATEPLSKRAIPSLMSSEAPSSASASGLSTESPEQRLAAELAAQGFSDISVGYEGDGQKLVLSVNNIGFTHSELDAIGTALGTLAFAPPSQAPRYRLVLHRWNLPILWIDGDLACLRDWLLAKPSCAEINALRLRFRDDKAIDTNVKPQLSDDVKWVVQGHKPAWQKLRIHLGPGSHYAFATEYGIWDYSVAAVINPWLHLWPGAIFEGVRQVHIANSKDYDPGQIFSFWRTGTGNGRLMIHQAFTQTTSLPWALGGSLSGRLSFGRPFEDWLGGGGEIRWDSRNWQHAFTLATHRYVYQGDLLGYIPGQPSSIAYRYMPNNSDWQFEAVYGRWWNRDQSLSFASRHWFGDMNLGFFVQRYKDARPLWFGGRDVAFAGIELSFPLSFRREIETGKLPFDIRGLPRYGIGLATTVGRTDNAFVGSGGYPLYAHLGVGSGVPFATGAILRDFDRLGSNYTPYHLERARYAFERWVKPRLRLLE